MAQAEDTVVGQAMSVQHTHRELEQTNSLSSRNCAHCRDDSFGDLTCNQKKLHLLKEYVGAPLNGHRTKSNWCTTSSIVVVVQITPHSGMSLAPRGKAARQLRESEAPRKLIEEIFLADLNPLFQREVIRKNIFGRVILFLYMSNLLFAGFKVTSKKDLRKVIFLYFVE